MKLSMHILSLGVAAALASAIPVAQRQEAVYQLVVSAENSKDLDGQVVTINNSILGVYDGDFQPAKVYEVKSQDKPGHSELHVFPVGIVDHILGLKGNTPLFELTDITNMGQAKETPHYSDSFKLEGGYVTQALPGGWVAVHQDTDSWKIKWNDGTGAIAANYVPIKIAYKKSGY